MLKGAQDKLITHSSYANSRAKEAIQMSEVKLAYLLRGKINESIVY
jgi:hypothetical protein